VVSQYLTVCSLYGRFILFTRGGSDFFRFFLSCLKIGSLKFLNGHIPVFLIISISRMSQKKSFECYGGAPNTD